jgi:hypothetical protein
MLAKINGHQHRALLNTGSLGDFMTTAVADQLGLKRTVLKELQTFIRRYRDPGRR